MTNLPIAKHYYECHVTIEPAYKHSDRELIEQWAHVFYFRLAEFLFRNGAKANPDTFLTSRHKDYDILHTRMINLIKELQQAGFKILRYKIEDTIMDSKINDEENLL